MADLTPDRGHLTLPHTADVIVEAWGPDLAACCEEAVAGLVGLYTDARPAAGTERRTARIEPDRDDAQLLAVLNEMLFALDTSSGVPVGAEVSARDDGALDVQVLLAQSAAVTQSGSLPKAVPVHELRLHRRDHGLACHFLVDV